MSLFMNLHHFWKLFMWRMGLALEQILFDSWFILHTWHSLGAMLMFMDYCTNLEIIVYICNSVGAFLESRCTLTCSMVRLVAMSRNLSKRQMSTLWYRTFVPVVCMCGWDCRSWEVNFKLPFSDILLIQ